MSDKYPKTPLPEDVFRIPTKEEALADGIKKEFLKRKEKKAKGGQAKVGRVMREFKKGELHSGKKGPVVKNPKQAIAIALSEAGMSKPQKKQAGGMIRFRKQYQMHNGKF
jgi:hypothetical protein